MSLPYQWDATQTGASALAGRASIASVLLAGRQDKLEMWRNAFSSDQRFQVTALATDPPDLRSKLSTRPDIVLLDAAIYEGPKSLMEGVNTIGVSTYVVMPQMQDSDFENAKASLLGIPGVKAVFHVDVHIASLMEQMFGEVRIRQVSADAWDVGRSGGSRPVATRIITVWNQMGGVGKTTTSTNLAWESAQRNYRTLLIGLGAPDDLPLVIGKEIKIQPNILNWQANPTPEGLDMAIQRLGTLDIIAGYPDILSEAEALEFSMDDPRGIANLVDTAIRKSYSVIIIDAPPSSLAAMAMAASNTLVIVARPSLEGVWRTASAYQTVARQLEGLHNITEGNISVVLNRTQPGQRVDAATWHRKASEHVDGHFPPVVATIPDIPDVGNAQDARILPVQQVNAYRDALKPLVDMLFSANGSGSSSPTTKRREANLGGVVKIRY